MLHMTYFYNCSKPYLDSISPDLYKGITGALSKLKKRATQAEINKDLFWLLTTKGWSYDTTPAGLASAPQTDLPIEKISLAEIKNQNSRDLSLTSANLETRWHADFGKLYAGQLVQLEAQFGKVEAMFKDFCGFRIAFAERRLALGIEIVISAPTKYFAHRKNAVSGMASFDIAKNTLATIGLDCPIWLIGIKE